MKREWSATPWYSSLPLPLAVIEGVKFAFKALFRAAHSTDRPDNEWVILAECEMVYSSASGDPSMIRLVRSPRLRFPQGGFCG
jgi:hypothetical protein